MNHEAFGAEYLVVEEDRKTVSGGSHVACTTTRYGVTCFTPGDFVIVYSAGDN